MRNYGFPAQVHDVEDIDAVKRLYGVPLVLTGCHTAIVEGYVIEGHVPADAIDRLLRERPQSAGLAVPGMPIGSPGMEISGLSAVAYDVVAFDVGGKSRVFESR